MKKFISLTLITIMILAATVLPTFAAESTELTRSEAEKIFYDAYIVFHAYKYPTFMDHTHDYKEYFELESPGDDSLDNHSFIVDGVEYSYLYLSKLCLSDATYENLTIEKLKEIAGMYYLEKDIDSLMVDVAFEDNKTREQLFYEKNGKVYPLSNSDFSVQNMYYIVSYSDFSVSGNNASMKVLLTRAYRQHASCYLTATVDFVKTEKGWRLASNPFAEENLYNSDWESMVEYWINAEDNKTYYGNPENPNPNTGDTTAATAALLATIALAAVITPFALSKKRKRKV